MSNNGSDYIDRLAMGIIGINIILAILIIPFNVEGLQPEGLECNGKPIQTVKVNFDTCFGVITVQFPDLSKLSFSDILGSLVLIGSFFSTIFGAIINIVSFIGNSFGTVLKIFLEFPLNIGTAWICFSSIVIALFIFKHAREIMDMFSSLINAIGSLIPG